MPNIVEQVLEKAGESIDPIGKALMGQLWRDVYETFQDAIALSLLFVIPGVIVKFFTGVDYSDFDQCLAISASSINRYACFVIVASGFLLWIIVTGRIIGRTINSIFSRKKK